jgi:hypothetical protein
MIEEGLTSQVWRVLLASLGVLSILLSLTVVPLPFSFWVLVGGIGFLLVSVTAK